MPPPPGDGLIPDPSGDQLDPSQLAMQLALTPPAEVKEPVATRLPFASVVRALAQYPSPQPSDDQAVPFQRAI